MMPNRNRFLPAAYLPGVLVATGLLSSMDAAAAQGEPSPYCDALLEPAHIAAAVAQDDTGLARRTGGFMAEDNGRCSRIYSIGGSRFSDELIFLATPARDPAAAREDIDRMAGEAQREGYFGIEESDHPGEAAVRFIRPDPLSSHRIELNVSFAQDGVVYELKYQSVDDGELNKFVLTLDELREIAAGVALRATRLRMSD